MKYLGANAIGTTFHDRNAAVAAINQDILDIALIRYNPRHVGACEDVFPRLVGHKALVYNFKSSLGFPDPSILSEIPENCWKPTISDFYRFALTRPELSGILCSFGEIEHIRALEEAMKRGPLNLAEEAQLIDLAKRELQRQFWQRLLEAADRLVGAEVATGT